MKTGKFLSWNKLAECHVTETTLLSRRDKIISRCYVSELISSRAGESYTYIRIRQREKLEYFLLNFLQKRRLTLTLSLQIHRVCRDVTGAPESPENMKTTAPREVSFYSRQIARETARMQLRVVRFSSRDGIIFFWGSFDASFTTRLTRVSIFRIENNQMPCYAILYTPVYFTLRVIKENWPVIFTVFL